MQNTNTGTSNSAPIKGSEFYHSSTQIVATCILVGKPTGWLINLQKDPDCINFFVVQVILSPYVDPDNICDLSSENSPLFLTLSSDIIHRKYSLPRCLVVPSYVMTIHTDNYSECVNIFFCYSGRRLAAVWNQFCIFMAFNEQFMPAKNFMIVHTVILVGLLHFLHSFST